MAQFELIIRSNDNDDFESLCARFLGSRYNEPRHGSEEQQVNGQQQQTEEPEKPTRRGRGRKAQQEQQDIPAPTQEPTTGQPIPPTDEPVPQPTPGGTEAPPAESIPPKQDVFETSATPAASSPETAQAEAAGDVTMQQLKDAMAELLKVKSAAFAMKTLEDATGCKSLSSGSPSVAEKAKDDPKIMKTALDALVAGKTAA